MRRHASNGSADTCPPLGLMLVGGLMVVLGAAWELELGGLGAEPGPGPMPACANSAFCVMEHRQHVLSDKGKCLRAWPETRSMQGGMLLHAHSQRVSASNPNGPYAHQSFPPRRRAAPSRRRTRLHGSPTALPLPSTAALSKPKRRLLRPRAPARTSTARTQPHADRRSAAAVTHRSPGTPCGSARSSTSSR